MNKFVLSTAAAVLLALAGGSFSAYAKPDQAKIEARKKAKSQLPSESVGKKLVKAFELYGEEKLDEALALLREVQPSRDFDKASVDRFIGQMLAMQGKNKDAMKYLRSAVKLDLLNFTDQASLMMVYAQVLRQEKMYKDSVAAYEAWYDFTGEENGDVFLAIASNYYEMKQMDKIIDPADRAIAAFKKPNKGPYQLKVAAYYEQKKFKELVAVAEVIVEKFPEDASSWVSLAQFYTLVEKNDLALQTAVLAHRQGFIKTEAQVKMLASLYASQDVPFKGAALLEKFMKDGVVKKDKVNLTAMAGYFQNAREYKKAAMYFGEAAKLDNDGDLYYKQGSMLDLVEQYDQAVASYEKALENGASKKGTIYVAIGTAHFYQNRLRDAAAAFQKALSDDNVKRNASSWLAYTKETAERRGVKL